jgi:tRNA G18 (ribose-2'-O)-methylase SpoU
MLAADRRHRGPLRGAAGNERAAGRGERTIMTERAIAIAIEDPDDPRVAEYRHLTDVALRRAYEPDAGVFIAEGHLVITQLLRSPYRVRSFLTTPARLVSLQALLTGAPDCAAPVYVAGAGVMASVAGFDVHRGLLAAADRSRLRSLEDVARGAALVTVLEGINDHENMGAIFRNAAAFGVDALVLDPTCCDPLYRRAVRVSMGHVLRVPYTVASGWPAAIDQLRSLGFTVWALTPGAGAVSIDTARVEGPVAVLIGAEGNGLSTEAMRRADERIRIPIAAGVDSLNVATATAITLHHISSGRLT